MYGFCCRMLFVSKLKAWLSLLSSVLFFSILSISTAELAFRCSPPPPLQSNLYLPFNTTWVFSSVRTILYQADNAGKPSTVSAGYVMPFWLLVLLLSQIEQMFFFIQISFSRKMKKNLLHITLLKEKMFGNILCRHQNYPMKGHFPVLDFLK